MIPDNSTGTSSLLKTYLLPRLRGTFLVRLAAQVLGFISSLLLTRWLGAEGYGAFAFAFAIVTLLALPASLGFRSLLTREIAQYLEQQSWGLLRGLQQFAVVATLLASLVLMIITYSIIYLLPWPTDESLRQGLQLGLISLPFFALVPVWQGTLTGLHRTHLAQVPEGLIRPLFFLLVIVAVHFIMGPLVTEDAIAINIIAMGVAMLMSLLMVMRFQPVATRKVRTTYLPKTWLKGGFYFLLISGMHVVNSHTDILMIGTLLDAEQTGIYRIPVRLGSLLLFPFLVMEMVVAPLIAQQYAKGQLSALQTILQRLVWGVFLLTAIGGLVLALFRIPVLGWFGPAFPAGATVLMWFVAIVLLQVSFGPVGYLMSMTGHERITTQVMGISALVNIGLNIGLIPVLGITGAAIATLGSELLWKGLLYWQVRQRLGIRPGILPF